MDCRASCFLCSGSGTLRGKCQCKQTNNCIGENHVREFLISFFLSFFLFFVLSFFLSLRIKCFHAKCMKTEIASIISNSVLDFRTLWNAVNKQLVLSYLFSRLPFPVSRNPFAKGLWSIFSCVIWNAMTGNRYSLNKDNLHDFGFINLLDTLFCTYL